MTTLTIRIEESKLARVKSLAKARGISVNTLIDELTTVALVQHDAEIRLKALASRGSRARGLELLGKLDNSFASGSRTRASRASR